MSYTVYTTPALVCGVEARATADASVLLCTREAGMVYAAVKSVREERSKHRYALAEFSLAQVSLVKGKGGWRIVGSEPQSNFFSRALTRESRAAVRDTVRFLRRMVRGEEPDPALYDAVVAGMEGLLSHASPRRAQSELSYALLVQLGHATPRELAALSDEVLDGAVASAVAVSQL